MKCATTVTLYASPTLWGASSTGYTVVTVGPEVGVCSLTQQILVTQAEWNAVTASSTSSVVPPYDYATGGAFWAFGFTGVMIMYFTSHVIGLVLKTIKNG